MAKIVGEVLLMNTYNSVYTAVGAVVLVVQSGTSIADGTVDDDHRFEIELPDDASGEAEIRLGLHGGSSAVATIEGDADVLVTLMYNNDAIKA